jgi:hypothetical protein
MRRILADPFHKIGNNFLTVFHEIKSPFTGIMPQIIILCSTKMGEIKTNLKNNKNVIFFQLTIAKPTGTNAATAAESMRSESTYLVVDTEANAANLVS